MVTPCKNPSDWVLWYMPTIDHVDGFAFRIYSNDHDPAHVHAVKGDGMAIIHIGGSAKVREVFGLKPSEVKHAVRIVEENWKRYLEKWKEIHG
jgi:hypothetical protein